MITRRNDHTWVYRTLTLGVLALALALTSVAIDATPARRASAATSQWIVTTLAGTAGVSGSVDATGPAASFAVPRGIALGPGGVVYVADTFNSTVRTVDTFGRVRTFAGTATATGTTDANGTSARFNYPRGIAVKADGTVFVADTDSHTVRLITPTGDVSTLAGSPGVSGSADGTGTAARFNMPSGIAVDAAGNVFVADTNNHTIRKVTPGGVVSTVAGLAGENGSADGTSSARFDTPRSVAVDAAGNLYVADFVNNTIRKITPAGVVSTLAGQHGAVGTADGVGAAARFRQPSGIAVDAAGFLYVADTYNYTVRRVSPAGAVVTIAGLGRNLGSAEGIGVGARFDAPMAIAVDAAGVTAYVADSDDQYPFPRNDTIRMMTQGPAAAANRYGGATRYDTAALMVPLAYPGYAGIQHVIIASGRDEALADPVTASGLAGVYNAPILLVNGRDTKQQIPGATWNTLIAIRAANPSTTIKVHIIGGTAVTPNWVVSKLNSIPGVSVVDRIGGRDRYETSVLIAAQMRAVLGSAYPRTAFVANGQTVGAFLNMLPAGPIAASQHFPIILTRPTAMPYQGEMRAAYDTWYAIGSPAAVSEPLRAYLGATRVDGGDRFGTAIALSNLAVGNGWLTNDKVAVTNKIADAITGGAVMGALNGPLLYTDAAPLNPQTAAYLVAHKAEISQVYVFGGDVVVTPATYNQIMAAVAP